MQRFIKCVFILVCVLILTSTAYADNPDTMADIFVYTSLSIGIATACQFDEESITAVKRSLIEYIFENIPVDSVEEALTIANNLIWQETIDQRAKITSEECREFAKLWYMALGENTEM